MIRGRRPTTRPQDCRCQRCRYSLSRSTSILAITVHGVTGENVVLPPWPPPVTMPPCPWDGHLTDADL